MLWGRSLLTAGRALGPIRLSVLEREGRLASSCSRLVPHTHCLQSAVINTALSHITLAAASPSTVVWLSSV